MQPPIQEAVCTLKLVCNQSVHKETRHANGKAYIIHIIPSCSHIIKHVSEGLELLLIVLDGDSTITISFMQGFGYGGEKSFKQFLKTIYQLAHYTSVSLLQICINVVISCILLLYNSLEGIYSSFRLRIHTYSLMSSIRTNKMCSVD